MPDTPPAIRGQFYTTHLTVRCPNFQKCPRCLMCKNFNQHDPLCNRCEMFKPSARHHQCRVDQVEALINLEKKLDRPMFDINRDPGNITVEHCTTSFESENAHLVAKAIEANQT
jgi:hypothetical protein